MIRVTVMHQRLSSLYHLDVFHRRDRHFCVLGRHLIFTIRLIFDPFSEDVWDVVGHLPKRLLSTCSIFFSSNSTLHFQTLHTFTSGSLLLAAKSGCGLLAVCYLEVKLYWDVWSGPNNLSVIVNWEVVRFSEVRNILSLWQIQSIP